MAFTSVATLAEQFGPEIAESDAAVSQAEVNP
jgi:hypothetical protein